MAVPSLEDLIASAATADGPRFPGKNFNKPGGVDPLGLRQINFDLMDGLLPGINNVTTQIRPFMVVAWAWRQALRLARAEHAEDIPSDLMQDFVDRIEVIFSWSQFLKFGSETDLPGRRALGPILAASRYTFGGTGWNALKEKRRYSTALQAPVNYGPALKALGILRQHPTFWSVYFTADFADRALDKLEGRLKDRLGHPAFSRLGSITVSQEEAEAWGSGWTLGKSTASERKLMLACLAGETASPARRAGIELIRASAAVDSDNELNDTRRQMGLPAEEQPDPLDATRDLWRYLQTRQLFRLALEALLFWVNKKVADKTNSIPALVSAFLEEVPRRAKASTMGEWLRWRRQNIEPSDLIVELTDALGSRDPSELAPAIANAISFCLATSPYEASEPEKLDRLPLEQARSQMRGLKKASPAAGVRHMIESWVIAQHIYWSVGRGLADARVRGRQILRLRIVLEEQGWVPAPGATRITPPRATPDRLYSAMSLLRECRALPDERPDLA